MEDMEKGIMAWLAFGEALEDYGLHVVRRFGIYHLLGSNGDEISHGTKLFYQMMYYFRIKTTAGLLESSPSIRTVIILARNVDLFHL